MKYIDVSQNAGQRFFSRADQSPVVMLNLLKFKENADYSSFPDLDPGEKISGKAAYDLYMEKTIPLLKEAGSSLIFMGRPAHFLIGPQDENYDLMLLVRHESAARFLAFAQGAAYQKIKGHRTAALADSRLLPLKE